MSSFSDLLVKTGGAIGRTVAVGLAMPAAAITFRQGAQGIDQAIAMLEAAEATGQALGEAVMKEMPSFAWTLTTFDAEPTLLALARLWKALTKGGEARHKRDYTVL